MSTESIENILGEALQLFHAGRLLEARSRYRKILKRFPANPEALHYVGLVSVQLQDFESGITSIKRALLIKPDYIEAHFNLGNIFYLQRRLDESITCLHCVISLKPDHAEAYIGLGVVMGELKRFGEAISAYQQALHLNPHLTDAYNNLGFAFIELKQYEQAVASLKTAIAINPNYIDAYIGLARTLVELKQFADAISYYKEAFSIRNDAECAYELASLLSKLKRFDEAVTYYKHALSIKPDYFEAQNGLGIALSKLFRFDESIQAFEKTLSINPDNCDVLHNLGNVLLEVKRYEEAIACWKRALDISPDFYEAKNAWGNAIQELGQINEAMMLYEEVIAFAPDFAEARNSLGNALCELERFDEAMDCFERAIAIKPDYVWPIYNIGTLLERKRKFKEAKHKYDEVLAIRPDFAQALWNRSILYLLQGQYEKGWLEYEHRWKLREVIALPKTPYPCWLGEQDISGKKLTIQIEQGFGDAIQMVRYVNLLTSQGIQCWIQCPQPLIALFSRSFPDANVIDTNIYPVPCDYQVPLMSLPLALKTFSDSDIPNTTPYLKADTKRISFWKKSFKSSSATKVGLVWRGNPDHANDKNRSASLADFIPLITNNPDVHFISLQKNLTVNEQALLNAHINVTILDSELIDFDETAAVISNLNLMISIDSAPVHLAGALAVPTWLLLPFTAEWRWKLDREDSPWYPTLKLFRQEMKKDWDGLIKKLNIELEKLKEAEYA